RGVPPRDHPEPDPVREATAPRSRAPDHDPGRLSGGRGRLPRRLREPIPIQPRLPPPLRVAAQALPGAWRAGSAVDEPHRASTLIRLAAATRSERYPPAGWRFGYGRPEPLIASPTTRL